MNDSRDVAGAEEAGQSAGGDAGLGCLGLGRECFSHTVDSGASRQSSPSPNVQAPPQQPPPLPPPAPGQAFPVFGARERWDPAEALRESWQVAAFLTASLESHTNTRRELQARGPGGEVRPARCSRHVSGNRAEGRTVLCLRLG